MKKVEFKAEIKSIILSILCIFLFFFIPFFLSEGFKNALFFAGNFTVFFVGFRFIFFAIKIVNHHQKKPQLIRENKHFIREIPKDYSVAVASLLLNNVFDESVDIPATILSLIGKSILNYENKIISISPNMDISNLSEHEKYLCDCIINKNKIDGENFKYLVMKDALKKDYIEMVVQKEYRVRGFISAIVIMFVMFFITFIIQEFNGQAIIIDILMAIAILLFISIPLYSSFKEEVERKNPYKNTKLGQKELQKLLNLKDYLKEFSDFEKAEIEEAILWEDYVAYAYIFNINKNLYDEFEDIKQITHLF